MAKNWTRQEEDSLRRLVASKVSVEQMAHFLGKSEQAVYVKAYRMRLPLKDMCERPTMRRILEEKFGDVTIIQVHRQFYEQTRISQKRWPDLLYGYAEPTQEEIEAVARYFRITTEEWARFVTVRQLKLFQ